MNLAVTCVAIIDISHLTVQSGQHPMSNRLQMTIPAKLLVRLAKQSIIFGIVRIMALKTSRTLRLVGINRWMLKRERTSLLRVAILAEALKFNSSPTVGPLEESMAAQAGEIPLPNRMLRATSERGFLLLVAFQAKSGVITNQLTTA
jgi:hypothetical protein